mmetsp:Transcript_48074/g.88574  ORF Transcript_48074/g.88574 Transcript_48074/m.88574 type:complete len:201 (+) Transcript_48074:480-1082(+)
MLAQSVLANLDPCLGEEPPLVEDDVGINSSVSISQTALDHAQEIAAVQHREHLHMVAWVDAALSEQAGMLGSETRPQRQSLSSLGENYFMLLVVITAIFILKGSRDTVQGHYVRFEHRQASTFEQIDDACGPISIHFGRGDHQLLNLTGLIHVGNTGALDAHLNLAMYCGALSVHWQPPFEGASSSQVGNMQVALANKVM